MKQLKRWSLWILALMLLLGTALAAENLDGGADQATATAIVAGGSYIDTIDAGSSEWFVLTADQDSAYYRVNLKNEETDAWLYMTVYDEQNVKLYENDVYNGNSQYYSWKAVPGTKSYVHVWFYDKKASGRATLSVVKTPDVHGNDLTAASALELNAEVVSTLDGTGDADVFTFTTTEGNHFYRVDIRNNDLDAWLNYELLDVNGVIVQKNDVYRDNTAYMNWKAEPNAQYYVKLYSGDDKRTGKYTVTLTSTVDKEPDAMAEGIALVDGQKLEGAFDGTGDKDFFTFTTAEGSNFYRVDIKNETLDAWLNYDLLDANGLSVQKNDIYKDNTAFISWKVEPNAQYYVKLYSGDDKRTGKYTLLLSHTSDHEPDALENAEMLTASEKNASFDGTGDVDYFTFTAGEERAYYRLVLKNGTVDSTVYMELQDQSGLKVKTVEASNGRTSEYSFAAEPGAVYYLKLTRYDGKKLGDYVITVEEYLDPMGDTPETALKMEDGVQLEGTIAGKEDADYLSVLTGDMALIRLALENPMGNERMNVALLDGSGKEVTSWRVDAGTTDEKTLELAPNTTYYVRVKCDKVGRFAILFETLADLGGSDIQSAVAIQAGEKQDLFFEMKADADYVAFPEAGATIRVMATGEKNISVTIVDENGMTLQSETRIYAGNSRVYVAERQGAYLRIMGDGGAYSVNCCTESQHVRSEYFVMVKDPTCSAEGLREMYCVVCDAVVDTESIARKAHTPADSFRVTKNAACDDTGLQEKKCIRCGEVVEQETIPATGHLNSHWEISLKDTCTENGIQRRVCSTCGKQLEQEVITALGHVTSDWILKKAASCSDAGRQVRECRMCHEVLEEQLIPAAGHQYGEWTVVKEPTSSEEGLQQQVCRTCGDVQSQTIEKKGFFGGLFGK